MITTAGQIEIDVLHNLRTPNIDTGFNLAEWVVHAQVIARPASEILAVAGVRTARRDPG